MSANVCDTHLLPSSLSGFDGVVWVVVRGRVLKY